jgi:hypothetical protein
MSGRRENVEARRPSSVPPTTPHGAADRRLNDPKDLGATTFVLDSELRQMGLLQLRALGAQLGIHRPYRTDR